MPVRVESTMKITVDAYAGEDFAIDEFPTNKEEYIKLSSSWRKEILKLFFAEADRASQVVNVRLFNKGWCYNENGELKRRGGEVGTKKRMPGMRRSIQGLPRIIEER